MRRPAPHLRRGRRTRDPLAHALAERGVGPGDHVACYLYNSIEYLEAMLAAFKLRAVPINVNYRYVEDELRYLLDDADVARRRVPPRVRAEARGDPRDRCPALAHVPRGRRRHAGADLDARSTPIDYEAALAAASADARLRPALGRRPLHPLHRRHHRHAQGRDVAPRGHLLRRVRRRGRRRQRRSRRPRRSPNAAATPRTRCVPACPFMHGTAHWMAFSALFTGGTVVIPAEHRFDAARALGARRAASRRTSS